MYKWKIEIILKCGKELTVYYKGDADDSMKVAEQMLTGETNALSGFSNKDGSEHILVRIGDISAASISVA